jgi:hypothetical protein
MMAAAALPLAAAGFPATSAWAAAGTGAAARQPYGPQLEVSIRASQPFLFHQRGVFFVQVTNDGQVPASGAYVQIASGPGLSPMLPAASGWDCSSGSPFRHGRPGGVPGGAPGGRPGGVPGGASGGRPGGVPGGAPGGRPGGLPGGHPGGTPSGGSHDGNPGGIQTMAVHRDAPGQRGGTLFCQYRGVLRPGQSSGLAVPEWVTADPHTRVFAHVSAGTSRDRNEAQAFTSASVVSTFPRR